MREGNEGWRRVECNVTAVYAVLIVAVAPPKRNKTDEHERSYCVYTYGLCRSQTTAEPCALPSKGYARIQYTQSDATYAFFPFMQMPSAVLKVEAI